MLSGGRRWLGESGPSEHGEAAGTQQLRSTAQVWCSNGSAVGVLTEPRPAAPDTVELECARGTHRAAHTDRRAGAPDLPSVRRHVQQAAPRAGDRSWSRTPVAGRLRRTRCPSGPPVGTAPGGMKPWVKTGIWEGSYERDLPPSRSPRAQSDARRSGRGLRGAACNKASMIGQDLAVDFMAPSTSARPWRPGSRSIRLSMRRAMAWPSASAKRYRMRKRTSGAGITVAPTGFQRCLSA